MEQETLTLTLPFIRLKEGQCFDVESNYIESGVFFGKDSAGFFCLVDVNKTEGYATAFGLPQHIQNLFTEQRTKNQLAEQLQRLDERLYASHKEMEAHLNAVRDAIMSDLGEAITASRFCQANIMDFRHEFKSTVESSQTTEAAGIKGCISEDALVQLVKEIKK